MADNNKLELVVEVDVNKANASIKSVNTGLSSMEQAASKAARGASAGVDGMTASMVKGATAGNLLAEGIKKAIEWAKEWTIGAAEHAAHADKMGMSMVALAKAHGVAEEAAKKSVEAVKKVGFSTEDAIHAVDRLMVADMSLSKAEGLAKVAKDAAAIENVSPGEALEKLLMAIESGASRGLRTMGIFVDLNKEVDRQEKLSGKTLDENEVRQLRYNAVMREAAKIQGAAAAASGSAEAQSKALAREVNELKEAVGEQFQGYLRSWVGHLRGLVGFLKDNSDWLVKFGEAAIFVAGAIATYGIITKISGIASAVEGLALALTAHPIALLLTGIVAGGAILWKTWKDTEAGMERSAEDMRRMGLQQDLLSGKLKPNDVKKMGYTEDQIREIVSGKKILPGESWGDFGGAGLSKLKILGKGGLSDDDVNRIAAERKKRGEAEKSAQELYMRAVEERKSAEHDMARARLDDSMKIIESTHSEAAALREMSNVAMLSEQERQAGIARIMEEEKREIEQRSTYTDEKSGAVRHFTLNASTLETIHKATAEKLAAFDLKFVEEEWRRLEAMRKALAERVARAFNQYVDSLRQDLYVVQQTDTWQEKVDDQARSAGIAAIEQRKNLQLAQLDTVDARTLQAKVALENAKTAIDVQALKDRTKIELDQIDAQTERQVDEARKAAMAQGIFDDARLDQIANKITELGQHEKAALQSATTTEIDVAQAKGASATRKIVVDQYQSIFQSLKQQAGGVFDALLTKSQSVWAAIGNSLKTAMLTAIKDVVTSRVAAALMGLFTGVRVSLPQGGGLLGGTGGGSTPVFGGPGGGGWKESIASLGGLLSRGGRAGGDLATTPPSASSVAGGGVIPGWNGGYYSVPSYAGGGGGLLSMLGIGGNSGGSGSRSGGGGFLGMLGMGGNGGSGGMFGGLKDFLGFGGGGVQYAPGQATTWAASSLGQKASALGRSNAAMMGGAMLVMDGLQRGGWTGMAEDTAGGAMIGFKFGGPMGAAIGAIAGAVAGMVRMFVKGAQEKARAKIKALYGVDISDKGILKQIVDTAKSAYGGNLDLAIRSQQVRDLIQLYAMSNGQKVTGMQAPMTASTLIESGGSLYQSTSYNNGTALPGLGGLASLDKIAAGTPSGGGTIVIPLQIDSKTVGSVIVSNGKVVAQGAITAMKSNDGRREMTALQLSPGLLTS